MQTFISIALLWLGATLVAGRPQHTRFGPIDHDCSHAFRKFIFTVPSLPNFSPFAET